MKKNVLRVLAVLYMMFAVFCTVDSIVSTFADNYVYEVVTITDKYSIGTGKNGESIYMKGINSSGEYVIVGWKYDIGDTVTIFKDKSKVDIEGTDWYSSLSEARRANLINIFVGTIMIIIGIVFCRIGSALVQNSLEK